MPNQRLRAAFMRGGTSKAVMFRQNDLPATARAGMRSSCRHGLARSKRPPARRHGRRPLLAVQGLRRRAAEPAGCRCRLHLRPDRRARRRGRLQRQLRQHVVGDRPVRGRGRPRGRARATARRWCASTTPTPARSSSRASRCEDGALAANGDLALDGVAGTAAPIKLEFLDPGGAKTGKLLPTGTGRATCSTFAGLGHGRGLLRRRRQPLRLRRAPRISARPAPNCRTSWSKTALSSHAWRRSAAPLRSAWASPPTSRRPRAFQASPRSP